jgi:hypothetical protein
LFKHVRIQVQGIILLLYFYLLVLHSYACLYKVNALHSFVDNSIHRPLVFSWYQSLHSRKVSFINHSKRHRYLVILVQFLPNSSRLYINLNENHLNPQVKNPSETFCQSVHVFISMHVSPRGQHVSAHTKNTFLDTCQVTRMPY